MTSELNGQDGHSVTKTTKSSAPAISELETLPFLKIAEVAQLLRITRDTVYREVQEGRLAAENYGSGGRPVYRIPQGALVRWRSTREVGVAQEGPK